MVRSSYLVFWKENKMEYMDIGITVCKYFCKAMGLGETVGKGKVYIRKEERSTFTYKSNNAHQPENM